MDYCFVVLLHSTLSLAIGESFPVRWETTLALLGTDWSCDPMKMKNQSFCEKMLSIQNKVVFLHNHL